MIRKNLLIWITVISSVIFVIQLASLQLSGDSFDRDFAIQEISVYPERGLIFDRNGELLVANQPMYELIVIPENTVEFDTVQLSNLIGVEQNELSERISSARKYSTKLPSVINLRFQKKKMLIYKRKYGYLMDFILEKTL